LEFLVKKYDYYVDTYRIHPPIGGKIGWWAKARVKQTGTGRSDDFVTLGEHKGATEHEVQQKADAEARQWIAAKMSGT
jgi:hypothetical protein